MMDVKPSKPQLNLLRYLAGLEIRQPRMKQVTYNVCFNNGWTTDRIVGGTLTEAGRKAAGL